MVMERNRTPQRAPTPTTVQLGRGSTAGDQSINRDQMLAQIYNLAKQAGLGDEGARVAVAIAVTEGGLSGATGDTEGGGSYGPYQFYWQGKLGSYANDLGMSRGHAAEFARTNPMHAAEWALNGYLGNAIKDGMNRGMSGPDLATYAQRTGQVSVTPERAGSNYADLYGGTPTPTPTPGGTPSPRSLPTPSVRVSQTPVAPQVDNRPTYGPAMVRVIGTGTADPPVAVADQGDGRPAYGPTADRGGTMPTPIGGTTTGPSPAHIEISGRLTGIQKEFADAKAKFAALEDQVKEKDPDGSPSQASFAATSQIAEAHRQVNKLRDEEQQIIKELRTSDRDEKADADKEAKQNKDDATKSAGDAAKAANAKQAPGVVLKSTGDRTKDLATYITALEARYNDPSTPAGEKLTISAAWNSAHDDLDKVLNQLNKDPKDKPIKTATVNGALWERDETTGSWTEVIKANDPNKVIQTGKGVYEKDAKTGQWNMVLDDTEAKTLQVGNVAYEKDKKTGQWTPIIQGPPTDTQLKAQAQQKAEQLWTDYKAGNIKRADLFTTFDDWMSFAAAPMKAAQTEYAAHQLNRRSPGYGAGMADALNRLSDGKANYKPEDMTYNLPDLESLARQHVSAALSAIGPDMMSKVPINGLPVAPPAGPTAIPTLPAQGVVGASTVPTGHYQGDPVVAQEPVPPLARPTFSSRPMPGQVDDYGNMPVQFPSRRRPIWTQTG